MSILLLAVFGAVCSNASAQLIPEALTFVNGGGLGDEFGYAVTTHGELAAIGAPGIDSVYVIRIQDREVVYTLTGGAGERFGHSVATDGDLLLVGSPDADVLGATKAGKAGLYDLATGTWLRSLTSTNPTAGQQFGYSVDVDGSRCVVGEPASIPSATPGRAYVFDTATGALSSPLASGLAGSDHFGASVGISGDRAIVGAPAVNLGAGMAFLYDLTNGNTTVLTAATGGLGVSQPGDRYGAGVDIDGDLAVVGEPDDDTVALTDSGSVFVYEVQGGWLASVSGTAQSDHLGRAVAISGPRILAAKSQSTVALQATPPQPLVQLYETEVHSAGTGPLGESVSLAVAPGTPAFRHFVIGTDGGAANYYFGERIGASYCGPATLNSSGDPGVLTAFGSEVAADRAVLFVATQVPVGEGWVLLACTRKHFWPYYNGSQGHLCLDPGSGILRLAAGGIGVDGKAVIPLDFSLLDLSKLTWNFQLWFRDKNPGPTSNFTDGRTITFQ